MKAKIQTLLSNLNHGLVEREQTLKAALLTVLAGENLVLIGPPGTGKSLVARRIAGSLETGNGNDSNDYFEYLLTKFSTPEEIFGPLSITELKADRFRRNTAGYLPTVKIAFLDEIFKASSSILNALLTILNERIYHNGAEPQHVPMQALIAASNELPVGQEELEALYDRFLVRIFVDYVHHDNLPYLLAQSEAMPQLDKITASDLKTIQDAAEAITIPSDIVRALQDIWIQHKEAFKEDRRERLSDRRLKKIVHLLRVSAATNGRSEVDLSDVLLLKDSLWNHPDNTVKVRNLIRDVLTKLSRPVAQSASLQLSGAEQPTYEVAEDGVTLVPTTAQHSNALVKLVTSLAVIAAKPGAVLKGFKGSGTASDPFLIETLEQLVDLERPEIGQQGYSFRQVADIDTSPLSTWMDITFTGQYDGDGHAVTHEDSKNLLFQKLQDATVTNLQVNGLAGLVQNAQESDFLACQSDKGMVGSTAKVCNFSACQSGWSMVGGNANDCRFIACRSGGALVYGSAFDSVFLSCQSGYCLIIEIAENCNIADCLVIINIKYSESNQYFIGCIAKTLKKTNLVERCFVTGGLWSKFSGYVSFSGLAVACEGSSSVRRCALGRFDFTSIHTNGRIVGVLAKGAILENNISIDSVPSTVNDSRDGKSVAASLFKQRYFELTLGWDFEKVWFWDDKEDRPALREVGVAATAQTPESTAEQTVMVDLLTQQVRANIWL